jgi:diguanylate cyclase (GGDEF)-like protein
MVWSFFEHTGTTIVVLTDQQYQIIDCNANLTRNLYVPDKPVGRFLGDVICPMEDTPFSLILSVQGQSFLPQILRICYTDTLYRCYTFAFEDKYFVIGDRLAITDNEVLESMSVLNNELSTLGRELGKKNRELREANAKISKLVRTDPLTKLANRRFFEERYTEMFSLAQRQQVPLSIVMMDIDYFKTVNDTYGHAAGDKVLSALGHLLLKYCREEDLVARLGGEEFIICLPYTQVDQAMAFAQRIRGQLAGMDILDNRHKITISAGVAEIRPEDTQEGLINRADKSLYQAKELGRDQAVHSEAREKRN